jgi:hypothetical protein
MDEDWGTEPRIDANKVRLRDVLYATLDAAADHDHPYYPVTRRAVSPI